MNKKYGIGFFIVSILAVMILSGAFQLSYHRAKEQAEQQAESEKYSADISQKDTNDELIAAKGTALKEDCYYLMEVNGYIVVYLSDKETPYEYTDIRYDELPPVLREEIRNGKYMENAEELYGFLENYTS